jgi:hypothetical protein
MTTQTPASASAGPVCTPPAVNDAARAVAAPVASGQGVCTPLTINTNNLSELFIPAFRSEQESVVHMDKLCSRAYRNNSKHYDSLNVARTYVFIQLCETVETVRRRGGLLHCIPA